MIGKWRVFIGYVDEFIIFDGLHLAATDFVVYAEFDFASHNANVQGVEANG